MKALLGVLLLTCILTVQPVTSRDAAYSDPINTSKLPGRNWLKQLFLKDVNGGTTCATCSVLAGLAQQLAEIHNVSIADALDMLCKFLPEKLYPLCTTIIGVATPAMVELLEAKVTPDIACYAAGLCRNDTGQFCHLFPLPKLKDGEDVHYRVMNAKKKISPHFGKEGFMKPFTDICDLYKPLCNAFNDHVPLEDNDSDYFSTMGTVRGYYWRGRDCDDHNTDIYPGRHSTDDAEVDTNCNGIKGTDPDTGLTYESLWCNDTQQMGVVVLGDSASAHFRIPPSWLTSKEMSEEAYRDIIMALENELDWPMVSTVTGFMNTSSWPSSLTGSVDSSYLRFIELNRCNHRDYQNIGVNGARASAMAEEIVKTFARRGVEDNPVFLTLALIGNDVCNGHLGLDHMTKPADFYIHTLETLKYVDQHVAPGSVVVGMGLVDGRVLFDVLSTRIHPVGSLHNDITYSHFYDYLNCLQISPCFGWLNSNETWRNLTTERAMQLNNAFRDVVANNSFKNIKVVYIDPPISEGIKMWEKEGKDASELIEPVDGFHPSQAGHALNTELTFKILAEMEGILPKINPHNDRIKNKFGDQGGHF